MSHIIYHLVCDMGFIWLTITPLPYYTIQVEFWVPRKLLTGLNGIILWKKNCKMTMRTDRVAIILENLLSENLIFFKLFFFLNLSFATFADVNQFCRSEVINNFILKYGK